MLCYKARRGGVSGCFLFLLAFQVKELNETLAGMKGNLKRLDVMTKAWASQPLFERGAKTSTAENFQQMQSVLVTQRQEGDLHDDSGGAV